MGYLEDVEADERIDLFEKYFQLKEHFLTPNSSTLCSSNFTATEDREIMTPNWFSQFP